VKIREILRGARQAIIVVDSYVDGTVLELLKSREAPINSLRILTLNCPDDLALEASKFQAQYANVTVELRRSRTFHDRFLVVDGAHCWHLGASIKDAGIRAFMVSQVEDEGNRDALLSQFDRSWQAAQAIAPSSGGATKRSGTNQ